VVFLVLERIAGARNALDCVAIKGGKNADLALQVTAFSRQGILFSSSAKRLRSTSPHCAHPHLIRGAFFLLRISQRPFYSSFTA